MRRGRTDGFLQHGVSVTPIACAVLSSDPLGGWTNRAGLYIPWPATAELA